LDFFNELAQHYEIDKPEELTDEWVVRLELIKKLQFAIIHLAFHLGFDFLNVSVTDAGFQRVETDRTKGLFKYQEDSIKIFFAETGFNALDDALEYIGKNSELFLNFKESELFPKLKQMFFPTVKSIEEVPFNIQRSRLIFLALQPSIAYIEDTAIRPVLGETIFTALKEEMVKDIIEDKFTLLLDYIRKPLIYLSSAMLMEETGATLGDKGLYFAKNEDQQRAKVVRAPSTEERIAVLVNRNRNIGNNYLEMLKTFLTDNFEEYSGQKGSAYNRDNYNKKTFFA
jgi:hypothetical protein